MKVTVYTDDGCKAEVEAKSVVCLRPDVVRCKNPKQEDAWRGNVVAVEVTKSE